MGLSNPSAGLLAWSRFTYKLFSTVGLNLLKRFLDPLRDITLLQAFHLFWANLYDLRDDFTSTVTSRMRLACGGIKVMFGVDNPWANLLYHQCAAGAELGDGMLRLTLDIFVLIPMAKCVCKDVSGHSLPSVVTRKCAPPLPVSLLPTLYAIVNSLAGTRPVRSMACEQVLDTVKAAVSVALEPFFAHQYLALDALGSSVEYITATFDDKAGRCLDFQNDPHIVVIVPQPVDYFQRCAGTSMCRQACAPEWRAFQEAGSAQRGPDTISVAMESMFFPGELDEDLMLTNASASVELPYALGGCLLRTGQQDLALALAEVSTADVRVQFWCVPRSPSSAVYRSDRPGYGPTTVPGALLDLQFGDDTGDWLAAMAQLDDGSQGVFLVNSSGLFQTPAIVQSLLGDGNTMLRLENLWLVEGFILVDVLARRLNAYTDPVTGKPGAEADAVSLHLALLPPLGANDTVSGRWRTTDVDLVRFGQGGYWYTRQADQKYLFLPKTQGRLPAKLQLLNIENRLVQQQGLQMLAPTMLPAMGDATLAARTQRTGLIFATSRTGWDWLKQVRLSEDGYVEGVYGSTGIEYSVEIQGSCDEHGCEGCSSVQTQRLCLAYQKCALINCVGTPVHQRRPLCGVGALLRQTGRLGLLSTQGAWAIFTEILTLSLRLGLLNLKEAYLLWPEDQFLCFMCQAKDSSAQFFSVLTATINAALQLSRADISYMYGGASNVDTNADAVLTISSTAINAFMHQMALLPLYGLAVSHQIMMCQISGIIALAPTGDFKVSIRMGKDVPAGDLIAGQCLTLGAEVLASFPRDDTPSLGASITSLVSNALERLLIAQIEPILHIMDGFLAYLIGVGKALGLLVQSQNMARCSPPDFFLKDVVRCACGDHELQIPESRAKEGLREGALWCSGVLGMMDSNNQPYYVHNPYTYSQLQSKSAGLQAYVDCVAQGTRGYNCPPPNEDFFANQGVTTVNILVKCRENFLKRRWDPAAYMLFQPASWDQVQFEADPVIPSGMPHNVRACLTDGDASSGSLTKYCHDQYLFDSKISSDAYWQYERLNETRVGPQYTDACLVFTGPADKGLAPFRACVDGMESTGNCTIPAHLWTPRSDNDVPLATQHRVVSHGVRRDGLVQALYAQARSTVMEAIKASLAVWNASGNPEVNAEFFSVEGDVLHQTMDCIFMGPYSRVDYWPTPACPSGEECLRGPFWSRDENDGARRQVDPSTCSAPVSLPYTCGSPGRKSLMRYLVLHLLPKGSGQPNQNASNVGAIIRDTLQALAGVWADSTRYGCPCADASVSPQCCATNPSSPLLPEHLNRSFTEIDGQTVLKTLEDDMAQLYHLALENRNVWQWFMQDVAKDETAAYDWSSSERATIEAFFDPTNATRSYDASSEAMSPLMHEDSTLWDVCHASLKQVFFTLPLDATGTVRSDADGFDGDPARLEEFVLNITAEAFQHSPLFRHYAPRHAPSDSQMCEQTVDLPVTATSMPYTPFTQDGGTLLAGTSLPAAPVYHPQLFRVGARACMCGWPLQSGRCSPPLTANTRTDVCSRTNVCRNDGTYALADEGMVLAVFSPSWHCPETDLSTHWGFMDSAASEAWLGQNATIGLTTSSRDLFRHGRSGLRAGNVQSLPALAKRYISPATREVPLSRGRLTTCQPKNLSAALHSFVDDLFPVGQAVEEAGAVAYCLRYAIELARLQVFRLLNEPALESELVLQREVAERWRKRCGTQLHLLHICVSLGVFRPLADPSSKDPVACPHFRLTGIPATSIVYTTPACLVSVDGTFYDPCRAGWCESGVSRGLPLSEILGRQAQMRLRFDPRTLLRRGAPIGWIDGVHPLPDPEAALLQTDFAARMLADPDAAGNTLPHGQWWQDEGPMADNSEFCDGVLDWWPEDWDFPVGYHVTVPCEASETAFRGFVQAFALNESSHEFVYQHDLLRDASLADSHFGGTGLCRAGSFGMPMPETNNMRYCTQAREDDAEDFTLPGRPRPGATNEWTPWKCTSSSAQLPWPDDRLEIAEHQSSRFSVGTIPNMPSETARTYPETSRAMFRLGPWQDIQAAGGVWGIDKDTACQDHPLWPCPSTASCPTGFACRGMVCENDFDRACHSDSDCPAGSGLCRGVCLDQAVQCIRHSDCPQTLMCSGVGSCETPTLVVQNRLRQANDSITLGLAARGDSCGSQSRPFSLLRGSYWGNTGQDLLRAHGMCSFEDWFKYTAVYSKAGCSSQQDNSTLRLDPTQCRFIDLEQLETNQTRWWPQGNARPELMFVRPTVCDRDYERLQGFTQCAPLPGRATLLANTGTWESNTLEFEQFIRLHENATSRDILMARMDQGNNTRVGFLGLGHELKQLAELRGEPFVACGGVGQCYPPPFTVEGVKTSRTVQVSGRWSNYSEQDAFVCGAFGILGESGCVLDETRFPLYRVLCVERPAACISLDRLGMTRACNNVRGSYQASNQDRVAMLDGLRELFYSVPLFTDLREYLGVTACMTAVYSRISAFALTSNGNVGTGLYFPLMYSLYEIPFDWYYQCIVMSGRRIQATQYSPQSCPAHSTQRSHTSYSPVSTAGDSYQTYLQHVRAGYLLEDFNAYTEQHMASARTALDSVVAELVARMYPVERTDLSYPRCSRNILWRIGPYGGPFEGGIIPEQRAVIWNWYDTQSCSMHWHELLLDRLKTTGVDGANWIEALTYYDPDRMIRQDGASGASIIAEASQFILAGLGVEPLDNVPSGTTGILRFQNAPPAAYDLPLPPSLTPSPSFSDGTTIMDETVPLTCVFIPPLDPAFTRLPQYGTEGCGRLENRSVGRRVDLLRTCGGVDCSTVPIYQRRNGKFNCRYVAEAVITGETCTQETPGCETEVMASVYTEMSRKYREANPVRPPILAPRVFPWFNESKWQFPAVDLSKLLDHERNIQPDPQRAIMCQISSDEDSAVKFTQCNNPHYLRLKEHVHRHYKHDGGVKIPAGAQLEWPLDRAVLARGIVLSYANSNRPLRKRFVDALFDDETVCKGSPADHVCRREPSPSLRYRSVNPWLLGYFNPYEVCDVDFTTAGQGSREYIYTYCLREGNSLCPQYYQEAPETCAAKHQRLVQQVGVPRHEPDGRYNSYNLCHHEIETDDDGCMHDQGLLGGFDGLPVAAPPETSISMLQGTKYQAGANYTIARHLYETSHWSIPQDFQAGVFKGANPLWKGAEAPYGHLQIDENELGGHRIGVSVSRLNESIDVISFMTVERLALGTRAGLQFLDDEAVTGLHVKDWVPSLQAAMSSEDAAVQRLYAVNRNTSELGASCPLQRWTFYSGEFPGFAPSFPAAKRAKHLFHRVHSGKLSHPTMLSSERGRFLGKYRTSNGFCACPVIQDIAQTQCLVPVADSSPCSLRTTLLSLMDGGARESYVFPPIDNQKAIRKCDMMLDWPLTDGRLRDGTDVAGSWGKASSPTHKECHVLDRFRPFRYKYIAANTLLATGKNTISHGVCQTRRLVSLQDGVLPQQGARCLMSTLSDTNARFVCNVTEEAFILPRRRRLSVDEVLARRGQRRVFCAKCSPPPRFRSQQGRPIQPESSFGRLHRQSPERMLAKDLHRALCPPGATACPRLNESAWARGVFMENYLLRPHLLFLSRPVSSTPRPEPTQQAENPSLWTGKPWVYCPTAGGLRSGEACQGTITRAEWERNRATVCPQMVRSISSSTLRETGRDPMARTTFCPIDNTTDRVCQAIAKAKQLIIQANCIARGDPACMPSPFVYHPSSYEPSNNAWVHDSVKSFYKRVDAAACPHNTSTDSSLQAFARAFQRSCPANGVNLFVGVLQAVRVIVVDVAMLITTIIAMGFRTLQLFISSGRDLTRQQIGKNWAYIRSKARESLNTVGDLLIDTMLNSGVVGERLMSFLHTACQSLNTAAEWFLNVWCNYIQKYTLQFLAGIRKLLGITGAGFDILQDFMDEIFQGVLPAAFVAKYAAGTNFQNMLSELYSQPNKKKKRTVTGPDGARVVVDNIPDSANPQQVSRSAKAKGTMTRVFNFVGRNLRAVGKAALYATGLIAGYDLITGIINMVEQERLAKLYPENFTLFDLGDIVDVVDELQDFILSPLSQDTCMAYQLVQKGTPGRKMIPCLDLRLDQYASANVGTTSITPTMCWANAAPSLGQNSMFSCVASSTCIPSPGSTEFVLCATCPDPVLPGINKYGCDSLRQQCACSQVRSTHTLCAANRECGPTSECELRSSLSPVSYGTIPCANCPNTASLVCVLPPSGMPARCTCMLAGAPSYDLCSDQTGARTPVDSTRLCGYLHNRRDDISRWVFHMDDLIILPCAQVSTGICSEVFRTGGGEPLRMVVAETLRVTSGGRRLLADGEVLPEPGPPVYDAYESEYELRDTQALHQLLMAPDWNTTAAPCSTLALAYQKDAKLGLLETHVLHTCGFWRYVGRRVLARYNLTEAMAGHETFLLSMDDLVYALMSPHAGLALLQNPGVFASALMHHPWMKPVRAFGVIVANHLEYLLWIRSIDEDVHDALFGDLTPEQHAAQVRTEALERIRQRVTPRNHQKPAGRRLLMAQDLQSSKPSRQLLTTQDLQSFKPSRRLLTTQDVLAYSARIIKSPDNAGFLPQRVAGAWSTSSFAWPPRYNYSLEACPIAMSALDLAMQVALINKMYFENFNRPALAVDRSLRGNLPDLSWTKRVVPNTTAVRTSGSWASAAFRWVLSLADVRPDDLAAFFLSDKKWSLTWILVSLTQCDLASTLTCSRHDKDLLMSTVVFLLMFVVIHAVTSALGTGFIAILFLLSYPWFILWYVYGMAPSCTPLLPTCLLSDVIATVESFLPRRILFPDDLVCDDKQTCLRSCTELQFEGWADPLAFAICDTDVATCKHLQGMRGFGIQVVDENLWAPMQQAIARSLLVITSGRNLAGHRLCTWVSFITAVPVLALLGSAVLLISAVFIAVVDMLPPLIALVCQTYVFYEA